MEASYRRQLGVHLAAQNNLVIGLQDELDRDQPAEWTGDTADATGIGYWIDNGGVIEIGDANGFFSGVTIQM